MEAAAAAASDLRIITRHILPNCVGPIVVYTTLITAAAILIEATLSFLGLGIQPPNAALGKLIVDGQSEGFALWWLVVFPGLISRSSRSRSTSSGTASTPSTRRSGERAKFAWPSRSSRSAT